MQINIFHKISLDSLSPFNRNNCDVNDLVTLEIVIFSSLSR